MADFVVAYERMIKDEGGYVLSNVPADRGGQTYAGISRRWHPKWPGWANVDRNEVPPTALVRAFYKAEFWMPIKGDLIVEQRVADSLFNFAVNASTRVATKLAQLTVGVTPDGAIGPVTLEALNRVNPEDFVKSYALAKIARYAEIVNRDRSQAKFLLGWVNRTLRGLV